MQLTFKVDAELYEAVVDLAERYHAAVSEVARQCLVDGIRKYKDFSSPNSDSPFRPTSVMRAYPAILDPEDPANRPHTGDRAAAIERRAILADDLTGDIPAYDAEIAAARAVLGAAFLPQGGPPAMTLGQVAGELAFDPLAPTSATYDDATLTLEDGV